MIARVDIKGVKPEVNDLVVFNNSERRDLHTGMIAKFSNQGHPIVINYEGGVDFYSFATHSGIKNSKKIEGDYLIIEKTKD